MKKIVNITFWISLVSVILHFYVYTLIKESGDEAFIKKVLFLLFFSGGLAVTSYWLTPFKKEEDKD